MMLTYIFYRITVFIFQISSSRHTPAYAQQTTERIRSGSGQQQREKYQNSSAESRIIRNLTKYQYHTKEPSTQRNTWGRSFRKIYRELVENDDETPIDYEEIQREEVLDVHGNDAMRWNAQRLQEVRRCEEFVKSPIETLNKRQKPILTPIRVVIEEEIPLDDVHARSTSSIPNDCHMERVHKNVLFHEKQYHEIGTVNEKTATKKLSTAEEMNRSRSPNTSPSTIPPPPPPLPRAFLAGSYSQQLHSSK
ncbi:unnamed protein product, partial [Anisakis simplex]|uniref:Uncharacterized protein n=1 Tax=Anisakis simplex TaxID=6269 RepID=A0A0M3K0D0_ANISI